MTSNHSWCLMAAWLAATAIPALADDTGAASGTAPAPAGASGALTLPQADCPHCARAGIVPQAPALPAINVPALAPSATAPAQRRATAPFDANVRRAQVPVPGAIPRPTLPGATRTNAPRPRVDRTPTSASAPPAGPNPDRIPTSALAPVATNPALMPEIPSTRQDVLPALPADIAAEPMPTPARPPALARANREASEIPDIPVGKPVSVPAGMPAPVRLPESSAVSQPVLLPDPIEEASPPSPAPPLPSVDPTGTANGPIAEIASNDGAGPKARIVCTPPTAGFGAIPYSAGVVPLPAGTTVPAAAPMPEPGPAAVAGPVPGGFTYLPVMLGDQAPASVNPGFLTGMPPVPSASASGRPPTPPSPFARPARANAFVPWSRGFKIADNQSPMPQDRVFYSFNYFNNIDGDINRRLGSSLGGMQAYRELLGIEKTFWGGNASLGFRLPIDTLSAGSGNPMLRGNSTSVGNVSVFAKFLLWDNPLQGNLVSGGLALTAPTGPSSFAGSRVSAGFHDAQLQPFLGYIFRRGNLYFQGFSAIDVATDPHDVTMFYNDLAFGYFLYQAADAEALLSAVVPTWEIHINDPLNHRGAFRRNDPAATPDVLDMTFGSSFILRKRLVATVGVAFPVTGPHPFDVEALALLNFYFGRMGMATPWPMPPSGR